MYVSVCFVRAIIHHLRKSGRALSPSLLGPLLPKLGDIRNKVADAELGLVIREASALLNDGCLGLSVGEQAPERMMQLLGMTALASPTLVDAFNTFSQYSWLIIDGLELGLRQNATRAELSFNFRTDMNPVVETFATELAAMMALKTVFAFGASRPPVELRLRHAAPAQWRRYRGVFGCAVHFAQSENKLVGEAEPLRVIQPHFDTGTLAALQSALTLISKSVETHSVSARVRSCIRAKPAPVAASADGFASELGYSPRTLRRRLAAEGARLSDLTDEARRDDAIQALLSEGGTIQSVSDALGYSEPSAFSRAFKRWTGESPARFKRTRS